MLGSSVLEVSIGRLLNRRGLTLAVAESCTGGLVGDRITNIPGSSDYFLGGVIAYANRIKSHVLNVRQQTLARYGAVSEQTALEMAQGVRKMFCTDVGLAVTGIAGPGGGTPDKPVGLVYVALAASDDERVARFVWQGDRLENKARSAEAVLELLHHYLENLPADDVC